MCNLSEVLVQVATYTLCRRIGIVQFGMFCLKILQFVHKEVELLVGYVRLIEHIILVIVLMQHLAQIYDTFFFVHYIVFLPILICLQINGAHVGTTLAIDSAKGIEEIIIAAREDELLPYAELCKTFGLRKPVKVIVGGATRTESVLRAALEASPETEFFAVQDGARPLVTVELIDEVLDAARVYLAAAPAVPVRDTIKVAHDGIVERTPDRSALFAVQTPQVFAADLLKAALQSAIADGATITDDCSAVERLGKEVHLTEGSEENIKITTPVDLAIAEAILQRRGE